MVKSLPKPDKFTRITTQLRKLHAIKEIRNDFLVKETNNNCMHLSLPIDELNDSPHLRVAAIA